MVKSTSDPATVEFTQRRVMGELHADYVATTADTARLAKEPVYVNADTGEVTVGGPPASEAAGAASTAAPSNPEAAEPFGGAGARHLRIWAALAITALLAWAWLAQRRAAAAARTEAGHG